MPYDPNEPRVPAGQPGGGEWSGSGPVSRQELRRHTGLSNQFFEMRVKSALHRHPTATFTEEEAKKVLGAQHDFAAEGRRLNEESRQAKERLNGG